MNKLNNVQKIAKAISMKTDGGNTYFSPDIYDPDNQCVKYQANTIIALGAVTKEHLPSVLNERLKELLPNTYAKSLD